MTVQASLEAESSVVEWILVMSHRSDGKIKEHVSAQAVTNQKNRLNLRSEQEWTQVKVSNHLAVRQLLSEN